MALAIATNNAALNAAASASSVNRDMETSMARLSSGKRINSASDDAAGVAISSRLSAEIRGTDQAIRNALDGQALIDTAEGAHSEIENILQRMREISVQAANDTNNDQDRSNLQAEMNAMVTEIDRIAGTTTWAGEKLMEAELGTDFSFQVGAKTGSKNQIDIKINGMGAHALGLQADPDETALTLNDVIVGQSDNAAAYNIANASAKDVRQANISGAGVVTPNHGNTSVTLPKLGLVTTDNTPTISMVTSANDTITLNAAALTAGFTIDLESGLTVTATAGETTQQLADKINAGTGTVTGGGAAPASHNGHGYTAAVSGDVITLTAAGAITGGAGADGSATGTSTAAGGGTMAGVTVNTTITTNGLGDVTYTSTDPTSVNDAASAINAGTSLTNITALVGANGSANAGKLILIHNGDAAAAVNEHGSVSTVKAAYDEDNSDPAATIEVNGTQGIITFHENAGTTFELALALGNSTGTATSKSLFTIDTTADLQIAVSAINSGNNGGTGSAGTTEHGYTASIVAAADGSDLAGTIKLVKGTAASGFTQVSFSSLDLGAVGHASAPVTSSDGSFDATTGVFTPGHLNTTGTVSLTLGNTAVTATGISNKGASSADDATAIAAAINAGAHGYTAAAMTGADAGKVKITQPTAPTKDMDVTTGDKARESIVAIDDAIQTVNIQRSKLGAVSNRLSHTINNLTNISSNLSAAQGGIEDADFAHETTMLAKNQILQQASTAMLAQANASKQNVLSLLQG